MPHLRQCPLHWKHLLIVKKVFGIFIMNLLTKKMGDLHIYYRNLLTNRKSLEERVPLLVYTRVPHGLPVTHSLQPFTQQNSSSYIHRVPSMSPALKEKRVTILSIKTCI